jgi:hypothetical protein
MSDRSWHLARLEIKLLAADFYTQLVLGPAMGAGVKFPEAAPHKFLHDPPR